MADASPITADPSSPTDEANRKLAKKLPGTIHTEFVSKFAGSGVTYRVKLFGMADVQEPKGDETCQKAISMLKSAVKSTGEHKQKVIFRVNLSGITLVDASTMLNLYVHPVNKISFISKDVTDNRTFGYIVVNDEGKHQFFGIRTEKAAEFVILTLKELFQAVYDLKQAEVKNKELAAASDSSNNKISQQTTATQQPSAATTDIEPRILDEPVKPSNRVDSTAQLLDLLGDISFVEQAPKPVPIGPGSSVVSPWPNGASSMSTTSQWSGNTYPQNDPFVATGGFSSSIPMFSAQPQAQPFMPSQPVQPSQSPFSATQQPPYSQSAASPFSATQQHPYSQSAASPFSATVGGPTPGPQPLFSQQPPFAPTQAQYNRSNPFPSTAPPSTAFYQTPQYVQQPVYQPATAFGSQNPFPAQSGAAFSQPFTPTNQPSGQAAPLSQQMPPSLNADPFASNGYPQAPNASNPFGNGGDPFGSLLQPQPQQRVAPVAQPRKLNDPFAELNLLGSEPRQKAEFFNDGKPKPRLNEIQSQATGANQNNPW